MHTAFWNLQYLRYFPHFHSIVLNHVSNFQYIRIIRNVYTFVRLLFIFDWVSTKTNFLCLLFDSRNRGSLWKGDKGFRQAMHFLMWKNESLLDFHHLLNISLKFFLLFRILNSTYNNYLYHNFTLLDVNELIWEFVKRCAVCQKYNE